ncbi:nuclear transport factor 2 family protein [Dyadobacter luticola]|uniref:Nuclear transport factor 2 family protein n=1 Tax=Dyadobacter luticola TaxID=1979387 RepID=A0A5R9KW51_9BACT|nr:nuclear transport factor 2 family protein [Dyadobacter luticola]TLV00398.1 nuclear transport factor 2 family protein [Dyadobacter luticola]
MQLPENIAGLIQAQNEADSTAFANYFTEHATVFDEGASYTGRGEIKQWIEEATEKYNMQAKALDFMQTGAKGILTVEARGTFPGSPGVMHYHLDFENALISSLKITG